MRIEEAVRATEEKRKLLREHLESGTHTTDDLAIACALIDDLFSVLVTMEKRVKWLEDHHGEVKFA